MGNSVRLRALALATTGLLGLGSLGGISVATAASPGADHTGHGKHLGQDQHQGHGHGHGHGHGQPDQADQTRSHQAEDAKTTGAHGDHGNHAGQAQAPGQQGGHGAGGSADGDPLGNNGTVKIATLGELDEIPNNTAHPGCTFQVEWYGFDGGSDVVSTVTFAMQAPTSDATVAVDGPSEVPVGEDAASGAGTESGPDAVQAYTLSFAGAPHPQQGYHVRLTVATPRSQGNDTKTKVFWVEPCESTTAGVGDSEAGDLAAGVGSGTLANGIGSSGARGAGVGVDQGVLGETYAADSVTAAAAATADETAVPTAVDAGEDSMLPAWAQSPLPLTLISFALVLAGAGIVLRNRSRA